LTWGLVRPPGIKLRYGDDFSPKVVDKVLVRAYNTRIN